MAKSLEETLAKLNAPLSDLEKEMVKYLDDPMGGKYFAPVKEIAKALSNDEGLNGYTNKRIWEMVENRPELDADLIKYG